MGYAGDMPPAVLPLTLFGHGEPTVASSWKVERTMLDPCCWIDHAPGFMAGADQLLLDLDAQMDWFRGRRLMYGTWHREPRRTATEARPGVALPEVVGNIRSALSEHYALPFQGLFCNYYETGQDSVAWHADRIGRTEVDPLVAIVSLGGPRTFRLRPKPGRQGDSVSSHSVALASGDLLVMGGATQHHWEHAIPKTHQASPRMSVTMRASRRATPDGAMQRPRWQPQDELLGVRR